VVVVDGISWFYFEAADGTIRRAVATTMGPGVVAENAVWIRR
jgi:hypothetical protein